MTFVRKQTLGFCDRSDGIFEVKNVSSYSELEVFVQIENLFCFHKKKNNEFSFRLKVTRDHSDVSLKKGHIWKERSDFSAFFSEWPLFGRKEQREFISCDEPGIKKGSTLLLFWGIHSLLFGWLHASSLRVSLEPIGFKPKTKILTQEGANTYAQSRFAAQEMTEIKKK